MGSQQSSSSYGERIAFVSLGERGLQVYRALRAADRFTILSCPGPIESFMQDAWQTVCQLAKLIAREGERRGLDVHARVSQGEVWMAFGRREATFAPSQDRTWLIRIMAADEESVQDGGFERVLAVISQETRRAFQPTRELTLERDAIDLATSAG